ncbi:MAG TPA: protein kinase [Bryobacteraceae bacterium]|jgi:Tol biopolymer transport system component
MTQAGVIMGTAAYMAPEQAAGTAVDKRADIWSFGVVLHEMLSGKRLFSGDTVAHTLADVLRAPIEFNNVTAPAPLKNLLRRCLDRNVSTRLRDIGEARVLLQNPIAEDLPAPSAPPAAAKKPGFLWPAVAALGVIVAAAALAVPYFRPATVPEVTRFEIHAPPGTVLPLGTPAVSPDGRTIVFTAADKQQTLRLYVRTLDSLDTRVLPGTENAAHPFFSPDGRSIAFASGSRELMRIDLADGAPRVLADLTGPWHGSWSQNGVILFQSSGLNQISANGGTPNPLLDAAFPFFLPDGNRFLSYMTAQASKPEDKPHIDLIALGSKQHTPVLSDVSSAAIPATVPGGAMYLLYMRRVNVIAQQFDPSTGKLLGEPTAILDNVGRVANPALMPALGVSASGTLAFQRSANQGDGRLTWYDRTGKPISELAPEAVGRGPVLSPDGQFAAVLRADTSSLNEAIWVTDLKRGTSSRLTFAKERDRFPVWSGDSKRITFNRDGVGVFEKDASGAGAEVLLLPGKSQFSRSPDGKYLIQNEGSGPGKAILVPIPADAASGKNPVAVGSANGRNQNFEFSPDGKYIAYVSSETARNQVYVQATPPGTGRWQISVNGGINPHWRRDGKELYFSDGEELLAVDVTLREGASVSAGSPHALFRINITGGYSPAPDGQRFLIHTDYSTEADSPIIVVQNWWAALKK